MLSAVLFHGCLGKVTVSEETRTKLLLKRGLNREGGGGLFNLVKRINRRKVSRGRTGGSRALYRFF